jgi:hypothetical protein
MIRPRGGRLQTLGLGSARLAARSYRRASPSCSSESRRCMATSRSVALRRCALAWVSRSEGSGTPRPPHGPPRPTCARTAFLSTSNTSQNTSGCSSSWCSANQSPLSPSAPRDRLGGGPGHHRRPRLRRRSKPVVDLLRPDRGSSDQYPHQSCWPPQHPTPRHLRLGALAAHPRARRGRGWAGRRHPPGRPASPCIRNPLGAVRRGGSLSAGRDRNPGWSRWFPTQGSALARGRRTAHPRCRPGQPRSPGRRGGCRGGRARERGCRRPRQTTPARTQHSSAPERA